MANLHSAVGALWVLQILVSAFLAILFLQSGIDKIVDRTGNLQWLTGHFAKSPLRGLVPLLLTVVTILELAAGFLSGLGSILIILRYGSAVAFYGAVISAISILALFFGQRMARDYAGASVLVSYFLVIITAIYLLGV
jgi:diacylglycerol kinase